MGFLVGLVIGYILGAVCTGREIKYKLNNYFYEKGYSNMKAKKEIEYIFKLED